LAPDNLDWNAYVGLQKQSTYKRTAGSILHPYWKLN
jgi:hypothetical protein